MAVDGAIVLAFRVPAGKQVPWISGVDVQPVDGSGDGTWPCGPDAVMDPTCVHFDLTSFRLLDGSNTRATLLPDGTPIRSRSVLNPDEFPVESGQFVVLDEVIQNPRPDLWDRHEKVLALPYLYTRADQQKVGFLPFSSALEVDLPLSTFVQVTLFSPFSEELFTVQGLHDAQVVVTTSTAGFGFHELTLNQPDGDKAINSQPWRRFVTAPWIKPTCNNTSLNNARA